MRLGSFFAAVLLAGTLTQPASAQPLQAENLLVPMPKGFKVGAAGRRPNAQIVEYVPADETVESWSRMVTQQIFYGARGIDPDALPNSMTGGWAQACPGGTARKVHAGAENSYPVSIWMFLCPLNPATQKPENMWIKVISGADSLYSVQYAYRSAATAEMVPPTMSYLKSVTVCDTRRTDAKCPEVSGAPSKP